MTDVERHFRDQDAEVGKHTKDMHHLAGREMQMKIP